MRTRTLTLTVGVYSDGTYHLALVESSYERGRLVNTGMKADRWATRGLVRRYLDVALEHLLDSAEEDERQRQVAAAERDQCSHAGAGEISRDGS